jgi:membrane-bound serine protease (ClpP class)
MLNNDFFNFDFVPLGDIVVAMFATLGGISGSVLLLFLGGARLSQTRAFSRIALTDTQQAEKGYTSTTHSASLQGKVGTAFTVLRPSGKVLIDDVVYDAFTRGEYLEQGDPVEVISTESSTLRVRKKV